MKMKFIFLAISLVFLISVSAKSQIQTARIYKTGFTADIDYLGNNAIEKMDLYFPEDASPGQKFPGIVIIHGGGWTSGDKGAKRDREIGNYLSEHGYVCIAINYSLADKTPTFPLNIMQCKAAVRYLRVNAARLKIDPTHIGVIGGSAGGHLALMVGYTGDEAFFRLPGYYENISDRVQAVVDMYGITDLLTREICDSTGKPTGVLNDGSSVKYVGSSRKEGNAFWENASPVNHVSEDDPPTLIMHGLKDATVDWKQSVELDSLLSKYSLPHALMLVENAGHTFTFRYHSNGKPLDKDLSPLVLEFFDKWLKPVADQK
jgi:acetyl esterase/lipase